MGRTGFLLAAKTAVPLLLALLVAGDQAFAQGPLAGAAAKAPKAGAGHGLLVGVVHGPRAAARARLGTRVAQGVRLLPRTPGSLRRLRRTPGVRWVEPNRRFAASALSDDPLLDRQWGLQAPTGIGAAGAWWTTTGGEVTVAVLDSGIRTDHPDLAPNLWTNPAEIPANGADDDRNGWVDDVHGADVVGADGDPQDKLGHGTAVAGVIGARGGNGLGISGVAPHVRLQAIQVLDNSGVGTTATVVEGIHYALAHGARVINISLNGPQGSRALEEAIGAAEAAGVVVVASAGNDGQSRELVSSYPASIDSPALVSAASIGPAGFLAPGSAYGPRSVDLAAPGADVLSTTPTGYGPHTGTSFAAAHVSGVLALLAAARPGASGAELSRALLAGARRPPALAGLVAHGELDADRAIAKLLPDAAPRVRLLRRVAPRTCPLAAWRAVGDITAIAAYRVEVDGHRTRAAGVAGPGHRPCGRRLRPGLHRLRATALDASRVALARISLTVRIPRRQAGAQRR